MLFKGLNGKLTSIPSGWIDQQYLRPASGRFAGFLQFVKIRALYLMFFPLSALIDSMVSACMTGFYMLLAFKENNELAKHRYKSLSNTFLELLVKNMMGLIAFPLGIVSPLLVSFYFVPERIKKDDIASGGDIYYAKGNYYRPNTTSKLQEIIRLANEQKKSISIIGAGKSQGKQFLPVGQDNIAIDMAEFNRVSIKPEQKIATVGAGATWGDLQNLANNHSLAVKVMQASNIFSIGGSISTNIHGWHKEGIIGNTIQSLKILDSNGKIKILTPADELFSYVVGGFGQFGIILEAKIKLTDNVVLTEKSKLVSPSDYVEYFQKNVKEESNVQMHLYRLSLDPSKPLSEGVAVNYVSKENPVAIQTPSLQQEGFNGTRLQRILINLIRRFDPLRKLYWSLEKNRLLVNSCEMTTNSIMHPPINAMFNHSVSETEWLQEYFIPGDRLEEYLAQLGNILKSNNVCLINATVRYVARDTVTKLGYANQGDRFAVVLCFNQSLSHDAVASSKKWIRQAIDCTLEHGGSYYLPYQAFATDEQFQRSYPAVNEIIAAKQKYDVKGIFQSGFGQQYLFNQETTQETFYHRVMKSDRAKTEFSKFLKNILCRVDQVKLFALLDEILQYADTKEEIYQALLLKIPTIMPNTFTDMSNILGSLTTIKKDLTEQALELLPKNQQYDGLIEIGYPGRFIKSFKTKLDIKGDVVAINDEERLSDYVQTGYPRPYHRFVKLGEYEPLSEMEFKDNSAELISIFIGLHHIPEEKLEPYLQSLRRVLKPDGHLLLVDHDIQNQETLDQANMAHSIYNAVMGFSLEEEMAEIRNFRPLSYWVNLLQKNGFNIQMQSLSPQIREGDPTLNSMIHLVNSPKNELHVENKPDYDQLLSNKRTTVLHQFPVIARDKVNSANPEPTSQPWQPTDTQLINQHRL